MQFVSAFSGYVLLFFMGLMPILNPPGHAPIFLALTSSYSKSERRILARKVGLYSFLLIVGSMFIGTHVLRFFDVSLPIVRLTGGMLVAAAGWHLIHDDKAGVSTEGSDDSVSPDQLGDRAFYPLTFPITVGPGAITVAITLGVGMQTGSHGQKAMLLAAGVIAAAAIAWSLYFCYRHADRLLNMLGFSGAMVMMRLSAFIIICLGVQICWTGLTDLILEFTKLNLPGLLK